MKPLIALLVAALGIAALALVLDSPALVLLSITAIGGVILGTLALGVQGARRGNFVLPFMVILAGALGLAALGVAAVVMGEQQDAPGLVLLGTAIIVSVVVGALALGSRTAQRSG